MKKTHYPGFFRAGSVLFALFLVILCSLLFPRAVHAYIDPTAGSLVLQVILGFLVGGLIAVKVLWSRITGWLKRPVRRHLENEQADKL